MKLLDRLKHAWNAFNAFARAPTHNEHQYVRHTFYNRSIVNTKSIIGPIYNQIAIDVSSVEIKHVRVDENGYYEETIEDSLNYLLNTEANIDQSSRAFIQDVVQSLFDEGFVALVPIEVVSAPTIMGSMDITQLRTGKILEWYPHYVKVNVYNERSGQREDIVVPKNFCCIIENPFYATMNEANSVLMRLKTKLNQLDTIDDQIASGKLDLIVQVPYAIKSDARKNQAADRRVEIETQLTGSKYGIAYMDSTEKVIQLNRSVDNNLLTQVDSLTKMLYNQLGLTEDVFNGKADEKAMINYYKRTIIPIIRSIVEEMNRKFLTRTARTQRQQVKYFLNPFEFVSTSDMPDLVDKLSRNEIMTGNEIRAIFGIKPSKDPKADELRNKNINQPDNNTDNSLNDTEEIQY